MKIKIYEHDWPIFTAYATELAITRAINHNWALPAIISTAFGEISTTVFPAAIQFTNGLIYDFVAARNGEHPWR